MPSGVLIIEDEAIFAKNVKRYLERHADDYEVRIAATARDGLRQFDDFGPDLVLLDLNLPDQHGFDVLRAVRERAPSIKVIVITAHGGVQSAVEAMKAGAYDYLSKPVALDALKLLVDKAFGQERLEERLSYYRRRDAEGGIARIRGSSPSMEALRRRLSQLLEAERCVSDHDLPGVLITGETGTGKELVARAIHFDGVRSGQPFIELNCAQISTHLLESELFGHERGAFTDARERKIGLVEAAHGGTLFLDEIGDLDASVQVKLLKLLEDRSVRRIGSVRDRKVDVRFVTATHRPLEELVGCGQFRSDLYYRLRVVTIEVPPLRDRGDDVLELARHFLELHAQRYRKPDLQFSPQAQRCLLDHPWPGNVRELKNVVEQAVLACERPRIEADDLRLAAIPLIAGRDDSDLTGPRSSGDGATLAEIERAMIERAMARSGGNVTRAAKMLGISRDTLRYKIDKLGLRRAAGFDF